LGEAIVLTRHLTKRCPGVVAVIITISLIAALANWPSALAAAAENLYRAQTIVTGQGEANRIIGFAACLEDVLIKASGALNLEGDPRLNAYKSRSADFVSAYSYHDQMSGTPKRDECHSAYCLTPDRRRRLTPPRPTSPNSLNHHQNVRHAWGQC
jgi:hypothetical protein